MVMMTCEICGKKCASLRGLLQHIRRMHVHTGEVQKVVEPYTAYMIFLEMPSGKRYRVKSTT